MPIRKELRFYPQRSWWLYVTAVLGLLLYFSDSWYSLGLLEIIFLFPFLILIFVVIRLLLNSKPALQIKPTGLETKKHFFAWDSIVELFVDYRYSNLIVKTKHDEIPIVCLTMFSAKDRRLLLTTIEQYRNICYKNSDFLAVVHNGTRGLIFVLLLVNVIIWSSYTAKKTGYLFDFFQAQQMQR